MCIRDRVYAEPRLRENTKDYYLNYINNHIIPQLGGIKLDKLTTIQIQKFYNDLQKNGRVPVSYTHLDVYKRQESQKCCKTWCVAHKMLLALFW